METDNNNLASMKRVETEVALMSMLDVSRCANNLPKLGETFELYSSYSMFSAFLDQEGQRLKDLMDRLLRFYGTKASISGFNTMDEILEILEKASDVLAERIANSIDEADGKRKEQELVLVSESSLPEDVCSKRAINTSWNKRRLAAFEDKVANREELRLIASRNVPRPQLQFQASIDNSNKPFVSRLRFKHNVHPNAQPCNIRLFVDGEQCSSSTDVDHHPNPYKFELDHFSPTEDSLRLNARMEEPGSLEDTEFELVETEERLGELCEHLRSCSEFAVDLEHHSYRSFQGITCLLQISTRRADYVVDTLRLWRDVHLLNDPFTDPSIVKVFHGADRDVEWLQRDFGVYVVNMFDTSQAMRVLNMARFSLAHLVKCYVGKELDKQFQLADWRIRPLPEQLVNYARQDTHYLLYCYDRLRRDLVDSGNEMNNLLVSVFERSRDICAKHYEKPLFDAEADCGRLLSQSKKRLNARQTQALRDLNAWRDATARCQDESCAYVLPNHMLLQMAEVLPREMQGLLSCCNPVPPLVKRDLQHLHAIVLNARQAPLSTTTSLENSDGGRCAVSVSRKTVAKPHDFSHCDEQEEAVAISERILAACQSTSAISFKDSPKISLGLASTATRSLPSCSTFRQNLTAYQLYKLALRRPTDSVTNDEAADKRQAASSLSTPPATHGHFNPLNGEKVPLRSKAGAKKRRCPPSEESNEEEAEGGAEVVAEKCVLTKRERKKARKKQLLSERVTSFDYSAAVLRGSTSERVQKPHFDPYAWKDNRKKKSNKFGFRNPKVHFGE